MMIRSIDYKSASHHSALWMSGSEQTPDNSTTTNYMFIKLLTFFNGSHAYVFMRYSRILV